MVNYDNKKGNFWEWECLKCNRSYARHSLKEQDDLDENIFLNKWCEDDRKQRERDKNIKDTMRSNK